MKERALKTEKKLQTFSFQAIVLYVKKYAKTCGQSYLRLLSI
jgi:hypothetical protein